MNTSPISRLRDLTAAFLVGVYVLPIVWWALSSVTPNSALLDPKAMLSLNFWPTLENYAVTLFGVVDSVFDARQSLIDSVVVALLSTGLVLICALPMAYALSSFTFRWRSATLYSVLLQRFVPPIVIVLPLVGTYHAVGLIDTRMGVALAHAGLNMPFALLLLKSFFDDIPPEVTEAAKLDGADRWMCFSRIALPLIKGGIAATAILVFIFSWTEFLLSLFLTMSIRLVPVQAGILVMNMWGLISAMTTAALVPAFIFILLVQKHLARGMTMGLTK